MRKTPWPLGVVSRLFGPTNDWLGMDADLVSLLENVTLFDDETLSGYANNSGSVCELSSGGGAMPLTEVSIESGVAIVRPGADPELRAALEFLSAQ